MKTKKLTSLVALLALSGAGFASAQTIVHVTGSTAYRAAVLTAEINSLKAGGTVYAAYFNGGLQGASLVTSGTSIVYGPGSPASRTIFENNFNGSIGGLFDLNNGTTLKFPSATYFDPSTGTVKATAVTPTTTGSGLAPTPGNSTTVPAGGEAFNDGFDTNTSAPAATTTIVPDVTLSDVFLDTAQTVVSSVSSASVGNPTPYSTTAGGQTYQAVGVVPFVFVVSHGTPAGLTNITPQEFNYLYSNGTAPLSLFSGVATDTTTIYATGRDLDSGTRATAFAETGFGAGNFPTQYFPYDNAMDANADTAVGVTGNSSTATTIGGVNYVPTQTLSNGLMETSPNGGYASGGNLAVALRAPNSTTNYFLSYLGLVDAGSAIAGGSSVAARTIGYAGYTLALTPGTLNGDGSVSGGGTFSDGATSAAKIQQGQYTYWGYEHLFYGSSITAAQTTAITNLGNDLTAGDDTVSAGGPGGVTLAKMKVTRGDDGASVTPF